MDRKTLETVVRTLPSGATLGLTFTGYAGRGINLVPLSTVPGLKSLAELVANGSVRLEDPVDEAKLRRILRGRNYGPRENRHFRIIPNGMDRACFAEALHAGLERVCVESPSSAPECTK